jgi:hypothetical protein
MNASAIRCSPRIARVHVGYRPQGQPWGNRPRAVTTLCAGRDGEQVREAGLPVEAGRELARLAAEAMDVRL